MGDAWSGNKKRESKKWRSQQNTLRPGIDFWLWLCKWICFQLVISIYSYGVVFSGFSTTFASCVSWISSDLTDLYTVYERLMIIYRFSVKLKSHWFLPFWSHCFTVFVPLANSTHPWDWNICLHERHNFMVTVGEYSIHGAYGCVEMFTLFYFFPEIWFIYILKKYIIHKLTNLTVSCFFLMEVDLTEIHPRAYYRLMLINPSSRWK